MGDHERMGIAAAEDDGSIPLLNAFAVLVSGSVPQAGNPLVFGAMHTAEDSASLFNTVADHLAAAVGTGRGQSVNCTLEGIEGVRATGHRDGE
jgi:hypothetical protein